MKIPSDISSLGWPIVVVIGLLLLVMLLIGYISYKRRVGLTTQEFFLANKTFGYLMLGLSTFAIAYSGNSFLGYVAKSYRAGMMFLVFPAFMVAFVIGMILVAPPLNNLTAHRGYVSPGDFIEDRFHSKVITLLASLFMLWGLFVQFLEQFFAMGYLGQVSSGGVIPYTAVIIVFAVVMVVYTLLGGFRGSTIVAAIQGGIMVTSIAFVILIIMHFGGLTHAVSVIQKVAPKKLLPPPGRVDITLLSIIVLVMLGAPVYPHILQHLMAAKDQNNLKKMFAFQAPIYLFTALMLFFLGIAGIALFPHLGKLQSDKVVPYIFGRAVGEMYGGYTIVTWAAVGVVMATLSTAGGTLITISMEIAKDIYKRFVNPNASERRTIMVGNVAIVVASVLAVIVALYPKLTIWRWTEVKFEILLQVGPAFYFGLYSSRIRRNSVLWGMIVGVVLSLGLTLSGHPKPWGLHAGMIGFLVNTLVVLMGSYLVKPDSETQEARKLLELSRVERGSESGRKQVFPVHHKSFWIILVLLLLLSVPWYFPRSAHYSIVMGLPSWAFVIVLVLILMALLAIIAPFKMWREEVKR